jgi:hypothetical protein
MEALCLDQSIIDAHVHAASPVMPNGQYQRTARDGRDRRSAQLPGETPRIGGSAAFCGLGAICYARVLIDSKFNICIQENANHKRKQFDAQPYPN